MAMRDQKLETLNIRVSATEKERLQLAAQMQNLNLSQFVLSHVLSAADEVLTSQSVIPVSEEELSWLYSRLEQPAKPIPALRKLLTESSVFE